MDTVFQKLVDTYREDGGGKNRVKWITSAGEFFFSKKQPSILSVFGDECAVVMHGSTTRNIDDPYSDLDFFLFTDKEAAERFDSRSQSRFIDVTIDGKAGHLNVTPYEFVEYAFDSPDFETIYELRHAAAVRDPGNRFAELKRRARLSMPVDIQRAALLYNYIEMRTFHRSADNPMNRNDRLSTLSSVVETVNYALRCAFIIDGKVFPYSKWLHVSASLSPTASMLLPNIDRILDLIQAGPGSLAGPEGENRVCAELKAMRSLIVAKSKEAGIDEPWLNKWWYYLDAQKAAFDGITWPQ